MAKCLKILFFKVLFNPYNAFKVTKNKTLNVSIHKFINQFYNKIILSNLSDFTLLI